LHGDAEGVGQLLEYVDTLNRLHATFNLRHPTGRLLHPGRELLLGEATLFAKLLNVLAECPVLRVHLFPGGLHGAS
jgi:hypothetical protein